MRLKYNQTAKGKCYYIIRSIYRDGKNTSEIYEKLGYLDDIKREHNCPDPEKWIREHLGQLNEAEKAERNCKVLVPYAPMPASPWEPHSPSISATCSSSRSTMNSALTSSAATSRKGTRSSMT